MNQATWCRQCRGYPAVHLSRFTISTYPAVQLSCFYASPCSAQFFSFSSAVTLLCHYLAFRLPCYAQLFFFERSYPAKCAYPAAIPYAVTYSVKRDKDSRVSAHEKNLGNSRSAHKKISGTADSVRSKRSRVSALSRGNCARKKIAHSRVSEKRYNGTAG